MRRITSALFLVSVLHAERFEAVEPHMGTLVRITIYSRDASPMRAAFDRIRALDEKLSDYRPESELNRLCRTHDQPVRVSGDLFRVLEASQKLSKLTDGAFDVTIGPVTHLWRVGKVPDAETMVRVGWRNVVLDRKRHTVVLKLSGMQLDLGAIAKGYAADEALKTLRGLGVKRALIAVSGDVVAGDAPPGTRGWRIGLEPAGGEIVLQNAAVSTSGDTEQFREIGGVRHSHIIDPKTGLGLTSAIAVTVVARRGLDADPIATAVSVLGAQRGRELFERRVRKLIMEALPRDEPRGSGGDADPPVTHHLPDIIPEIDRAIALKNGAIFRDGVKNAALNDLKTTKLFEHEVFLDRNQSGMYCFK